jgi:citrate lyase subunit beta / citryl-CoA lyase
VKEPEIMPLSDRTELPIWRSMLFVPVNVAKYVDKAHTRGADAIILDLEDSIAPSDKDEARKLVVDAAKRCSQGGADILVRINRPLELAVRDIEAVASPIVKALWLPKIESASHVRLLAEVVETVERRQGIAIGHTMFLPAIETAKAFFRPEEIASAHPRNVALSLGAEDFTASIGAEPEPEIMSYPKQCVAIAARAAGLRAFGLIGSGADFHDQDAFRELIHRSRRFGIQGSSCIHPDIVPLLNEGFTPTRAQIEHAERVVSSYHRAVAEKRGSFSIDGKMIDIPIVERAQELLAIASRFPGHP